MAEYTVLKPFNTVSRRLAPAAGPAGIVTDTEDLSPFTLDDRVKEGFLKIKPDEQAADAPKAEPEPAPPPASASEESASRPGRSK